MSQDETQSTLPLDEAESHPDSTKVEPTSELAPAQTDPEMPKGETPAEDEENTVGTGTSIALGCIAGTLLLIVFGLIFVGLAALF